MLRPQSKPVEAPLPRDMAGLGCTSQQTGRYRAQSSLPSSEVTDMFRCVRLWTDREGNSQFEEGSIDLPKAERGDMLSSVFRANSISFRETAPGGAFEWHSAPIRQLVLTLSGALEFETISQKRFTIHPGDVLLADDTQREADIAGGWPATTPGREPIPFLPTVPQPISSHQPTHARRRKPWLA